MKYFILSIVLLACASNFVQSLPVDNIISDVSLDRIGSDVTLDKIKDDIGKILEKLEIEIPEDFKLPPGVKKINKKS